MIKIVPIQPHQIPAAKRVIAAVAQRIFEPEKTSEEFEKILTEENYLDDVDNYRQIYAEPDGLFLVVLDDDRVVGTGALRPLEPGTAELKRIWLLEQYHGQGIGFRVIIILFDFARNHGYERIRLMTSPEQVRAVAFYRRVGFVEIPAFQDNEYDDISMEINL
jgi:putative acetyltransferase